MAGLPKFEDWKAPWEEKGEEFDADKAKKYLYDLTRDRDGAVVKVAQITQQRDELQAKVDEHESKDLTEVQRLQRELEQAKATPAEDTETKLENARLTLALEHGLTVKQAKRLSGSTPEELEADLPELLDTLGIKPGKKRQETDEPPSGPFRTGNDHGNVPDDLSVDEATKLF